jgi:DNA primase
VVCLDSDDAGLRAGHRLIERALPLLRAGKSLRFALMPQGADPDDVVRRWGGASLAARLDEAKPLLDFLWDSEVRHRALDTPERRAALRQRLRTLAQSIAERDLRFLFQQAVNQRWQAQFGARQGRRPGRGLAPVAVGQTVGTARLGAWVSSPELRSEWEMLAPIVVHPELLHAVEEELASLEFSGSELEALRQSILAWYSERGHLDLAGLSDHLCGIGFASLVERLSGESPMTAWYCRDGLSPDEVLERWRACVAQQRRLAERRAMREANAEAIAQKREDDAKAHSLAVDRLINEHLGARVKGTGSG